MFYVLFFFGGGVTKRARVVPAVCLHFTLKMSSGYTVNDFKILNA